MSRPTYCLIFESVNTTSGIGRVTMADLKIAMDANYQVAVVAQNLDMNLAKEVEWLPLYVPPRGFLLKWATARHFMKRAIGDRKFDIVHAHQPQAAAISDVFTCHFLTRVAKERNCLEDRRSLRGRLVQLQQQGVLKLEDRCYRNWNPETAMIYCSSLLSTEFARLYGSPSTQVVIDNSMPSMQAITPESRLEARRKIFGDQKIDRPIVGFLGGMDKRKGYQAAIDALESTDQLFLLLAGPFTEGYSNPKMGTRVKALGIIRDVDTFYAACDVLLVPSVFDPMPLVVFEAVAAGLPVIATEGVGNLQSLLKFKTGAEWKPGTPIQPLLQALLDDAARFAIGREAMMKELSAESRKRKMMEVYKSILSRKGVGF